MNIQEFDFSVNILRSLLWRNNAAPNIELLLAGNGGDIKGKQGNFDLDNEAFWNDWIVNVFDLRTANEFGLNVWSIILGINITINPPVEPDNESFGFGSFRKNFTAGTIRFANFSSSAGDLQLNSDDARLVLRLRYYQLTTSGNVTDINLLLKDIFGSGNAYVEDNLDMTINYVFRFNMPPLLQDVLIAFDVLPRPGGVGATLSIDLSNVFFGFDTRRNFDNAGFGA